LIEINALPLSQATTSVVRLCFDSTVYPPRNYLEATVSYGCRSLLG